MKTRTKWSITAIAAALFFAWHKAKVKQAKQIGETLERERQRKAA